MIVCELAVKTAKLVFSASTSTETSEEAQEYKGGTKSANTVEFRRPFKRLHWSALCSNPFVKSPPTKQTEFHPFSKKTALPLLRPNTAYECDQILPHSEINQCDHSGQVEPITLNQETLLGCKSVFDPTKLSELHVLQHPKAPHSAYALL